MPMPNHSAGSKLAWRRLAVLISGRGSNLQAIIDAVKSNKLNVELALVISNNPDAAGLERARSAGIETLIVDHRDKASYPTRQQFDRELVKQIKHRRIDFVCLAGFMR